MKRRKMWRGFSCTQTKHGVRHKSSTTNTPTGEHITGGPKCQRFYGYATNMETSKERLFKTGLLYVTSLKIMEFFGYKHLGRDHSSEDKMICSTRCFEKATSKDFVAKISIRRNIRGRKQKRILVIIDSKKASSSVPPMTLLNQEILYLNYGSSGPNKYVPSLHKYPVVLFLENDLEELISRWVSKGVKSTKIEEVVKTLYELGHEHKYITEIVVRRAYGKFDAFLESDYMHLHKNDIEDLYLMCINGKVKDYRETGLLGSLIVYIRSCVIWKRVHDYQLRLESYQQKVNLTALAITFLSIERKKLLTITSKPVVGSIYENIKKEKKVMIIKEILKFCDATLRRVLKLVEKKNMDVKHIYGDPKLSDNNAEYLRFYEEYIKHRLRHRDQMRRWESYVNGRPLGLRGDRPE
ncbi:hypothetical protein Tco_0233578 [Tanacetum coccineum]